MSLTLKPYPEYRDSGLPWLSKVPAHWRVLRAKHVFNPIDIRSKNGDEELLTVSSNDGVLPRSQKKVTMFKAESYAGYKLCWPGDLVINSLWAWMRGLGFSRYHGIVSSAYGVYRPKPQFATAFPYFDSLLRSSLYNWELTVRSKGIWVSRLQLTDESFFDMPIVVPPVGEAEKMAAYLGVQNQQIRKLIRAKRRVIELLNEQKQAIIQRAVTRGLDPTVRLKPSGVKWLGEIPDHWEVKLLHHLLNPTIPLAYGILLPGPRLDVGTPYIGAGDVRRDRLRLDMLPRTTPEIAAAYPRTRMRAGELVYAIRGSFGNVEVLPPELDGVNLSRDAARLAPCGDIDAFWLTYLLRSRFCQEQFKLKEIGATITGVNIRDLKRIILPVPPRDEQVMLAVFLDQEASKIDSVIGREEREIALLREYRTRLVADVVTGKLDVRGVALPGLEEAEEVEPLTDVADEELEDSEELVAAEEVADAD
jgi:type I restriction enzyme S subunit